ncbi:SH3 domain-containing protein [Streptomyces sp. NPDC048258]|uniref:SH3 domain-containing protein n=1 Tax=Streptomyces sp. NPDC048258 TaxID=3365527 RepID=UPI00371AAB00
MLKPTRTILALAAGSLVLGLVGAGAAVADGAPATDTASRQTAAAADGRHAIGKVVSKGPLKVRSKPTTRSQSVGQLKPSRKVEIECKKYGESVDGNRVWYRLYDENGTDENGTGENGDWQNGDQNAGNQNGGTGGRGDSDKAYGKERWVSARYVKNLSTVHYCR